MEKRHNLMALFGGIALTWWVWHTPGDQSLAGLVAGGLVGWNLIALFSWKD